MSLSTGVASVSSKVLAGEGLPYRHKAFVALAIFAACVGINLLFAAITGHLR